MTNKSGLVRAGDLLPEVLPAGVFDGIIDPQDTGYTHPVFVQCFLPTRHSDKNRERWQTNCGRMSLVIRAGELANPDKPHEFKKCSVPAGAKARFIVSYVNDYLQRHPETDVVDMGGSLRDAMETLNLKVSGTNGAALKREAENFAASEIMITGWFEDQVINDGGRVAPRMRFWLEEDPRQRTIWQPEMQVSSDYAKAIRNGDRLAPFLWSAMLALQHDTRAMDIHFFLVYRLRNGLKRPVPIPAKALHALFGQDIHELKKFWSVFKKSLLAAQRQYSQAKIEVKNDCIILHDSPPLIPYRKIARIGRIPQG
jgi:Plasmid encoded RepA protein